MLFFLQKQKQYPRFFNLFQKGGLHKISSYLNCHCGNTSLGMNNTLTYYCSSKLKEKVAEWGRKIPRKDKVFTQSSYICELHFHEDDIMRHWEHTGPDGKKIKLERDRPQLKPDAVPQMFPNTPAYLSKTTTRRKAPPERNPLPAKRVYRERKSEWEDVEENDASTSTKPPDASPESTEDPTENIENPETQIFDIKQAAKQVKLPVMWAVFYHQNKESQEEIFFCHLSENKQVDKCVAFNSVTKEQPNIYFNNKLIKIDSNILTTQCTSVTQVEDLLKQVHKLKLCPGSVPGEHSNDCLNYLEDIKRVNGKLIRSRALRCTPCSNHRSTKLKKANRHDLKKEATPKWSLLKKRTQEKYRLGKKVILLRGKSTAYKKNFNF